KFLVLGLGGVFLVRFYLLSHLLLFEVVLASYLATAAATLTLGNLAVAGALARGALLGLDLVLSRQLVMRSAVVAVLGCYLFVVGGLGWLLTRLGVAEELFWGSLVVFVSALGLATILLSESARWRLKRFLGRHVYRSRYDYREQWVGFTRRLGSLLSVEELAPQLVGAVTDAVGSARGALYLADEGDGAWRLAGARGVDGLPAMVPAAGGLAARVQDAGEPVLVENGPAAGLLPAGLAEVFAGGLVAVPLRWRGQTTGALLVGAERTGARYTPEDLEVLATVGEQAAGVLVTARLSETLARAREFEAFHRLTSFVLHDLKNAVAALSMLGQNAAAHFDDPEFQRDALRTLTRTVERMKRLMGRLSTAPDSAALRFQPVDVAELLREATLPVAADPRVRLVSEVVPVPPVAGDPDALLRVFQNLVANAGQALDGAGSIIVRTAVEGDRVVCTVSDTGCGIPEEFLRKSLFAPFRSTKKGGWGIGLYQVKGIVEGHGGSIEVASRVGEGTTVWVRLPRDGRGEPGSGR
ncbi:MAG TPA: XrtA/PEP-CTERM system histidine kinase PrsK, partial [Methylomirabilota bacterium]|nr:XrtA/PEP-CTERM system histidine kinase PrsK [Methylomirabilota bacterium]